MISIAHIIPEPLYRKNGKCAVEANPRQNGSAPKRLAPKRRRQNGGAKTAAPKRPASLKLMEASKS